MAEVELNILLICCNNLIDISLFSILVVIVVTVVFKGEGSRDRSIVNLWLHWDFLTDWYTQLFTHVCPLPCGGFCDGGGSGDVCEVASAGDDDGDDTTGQISKNKKNVPSKK